MAYEPTEWAKGDVVTSAKLNKLEQGVADASGGGGVLVVNADTGTGTLDKTWQEIYDAPLAVIRRITDEYEFQVGFVVDVGAAAEENLYYVAVMIPNVSPDAADLWTVVAFFTDSADNYPTATEG